MVVGLVADWRRGMPYTRYSVNIDGTVVVRCQKHEHRPPVLSAVVRLLFLSTTREKKITGRADACAGGDDASVSSGGVSVASRGVSDAGSRFSRTGKAALCLCCIP